MKDETIKKSNKLSHNYRLIKNVRYYSPPSTSYGGGGGTGASWEPSSPGVGGGGGGGGSDSSDYYDYSEEEENVWGTKVCVGGGAEIEILLLLCFSTVAG